MADPSFVLAESLLQEAVIRRARCDWNVFTLLVFLIGLSIVVLLSPVPRYRSGSIQNVAIQEFATSLVSANPVASALQMSAWGRGRPSSWCIGSSQVTAPIAVPLLRRWRVAGARGETRENDDAGASQDVLNEIQAMRVKDIQAELKARQISTADIFEKDELVSRLCEARLKGPEQPTATPEPSTTPISDKIPEGSAAGPAGSVEDEERKMADIVERCRKMRVKQLREELASRSIRWADMFEKEELVQRLAGVMLKEADFCRSGRCRPGQVATLTGPELDEELADSSTPILLDVYAVWCGPCKLMEPQFQAAAKTLQRRVRVVKLDSDKYPEQSTRLKVSGLPTTILFNRQGAEVARQEGLLNEGQIVGMVSRVGM